MRSATKVFASSIDLRRDLSARNLLRGEEFSHDLTFGTIASVIYEEIEAGRHGNFIPASYKRICANSGWSKRLQKSYTASSRVPRGWERRRGELECANSSDALLMNIFCYPRLLSSTHFCSLLGIDCSLRPEFGVRANLAMRNGEVDRTELDMRLGPLLVEAKLTESGFGTAARQRVHRYLDLDTVFDVDELPWREDKVQGYQLIRGVLAAYATDSRYVLLCDGRRADLQEAWYRVLRAVRSYELRSRMALLSWQELVRQLPLPLQKFLGVKYGIFAEV